MLPAAFFVLAATAAWGEERAPTTPLTGFYGGAHFGWAWGRSDITAATAGDGTTSSGSVDLFKSYDLAAGTGSYLGGLQAGYNFKAAPGLVVGLHADATAPNIVGGATRIDSATAGAARIDESVEWQGTIRGRLGTFVGNWMLYGTAGWAWSWDRIDRTQLGPSSLAGGSRPDDVSSGRVLRSGWVAGAGAEVPIGAGWSASLEYLFMDPGARSQSFENGAQRVTSDLIEHNLRLGANYWFGAKDGADAKVGAADMSNWAIHGQTTYVHQYAVPFREPYRGPNSLVSGQSRETWDATAYVGLKPWRGAEVWVNAEIDQGFGLADTLGMAGFPSGEAYKAGSAYPYTRVSRFFLRQTIDLGGKSEDVEAELNQFAGKQTSDRLVLTVGKFSVSDVFDDNKFAHDPRNDFFNWALIDAGTFDYAADAWGYTYGASAEYVRGPWSFLFGIFDLPKVPNSTEIDTSFRQYQLVSEIQHRHKLWGQDGEISLTAFLSHARMGRFDNAIAAGALAGTAANIAAVRQFDERPGIAVNIEQQVTKDLGVFARAGLSDGRREAFAFTDIDRTLAAGFTINGTSWGRPDDKLGVAGIVNSISGIHQQFLNAGGLGILVGDGKLPHPGSERILETYYRFPIMKWHATLDYQLAVNPAYNMDRGPVSILGTRLHYQF